MKTLIIVTITLIAVAVVGCASQPDDPHETVPCNHAAWYATGGGPLDGQTCERGMASPPKGFPYVAIRVCPQVVTDLIETQTGTVRVLQGLKTFQWPDGLWGNYEPVAPGSYTYSDRPNAVPGWVFFECEVQPPPGPDCALTAQYQPPGQNLPVCQ